MAYELSTTTPEQPGATARVFGAQSESANAPSVFLLSDLLAGYATTTGVTATINSALSAHVGSADPHTQYALETDVATALSAKANASNPALTGTLTLNSVPVYSEIPQNARSANYTLTLSDAQKHILHPSADTTARTFTIPANAAVAFPVGTAVTFINQNGGGAITISITSDTMRLAGTGATGNRTLAANGIATAVKITSTEWIISGVGLT